MKKLLVSTLLATVLFLISTKVSAQVCPLDVTFSMASQIALIGARWPGWGCNCYGNIEDGCRGSLMAYKFRHPSAPPTRTNGCGSDDVQSPVQRVGNVDLVPCCDQHDRDYDHCTKGKETADNDLLSCHVQACAGASWNAVLYGLCMGAATSLRVALGAPKIPGVPSSDETYRIAQQACICSPCGPNFPCFYGGDFNGVLAPFPQEPWYPIWSPDGGGFGGL